MLRGSFLLSHVVLGFLEGHVQFSHSLEDQSERLYDVIKDNRLPFQLFGLAESLCVDKLHLF